MSEENKNVEETTAQETSKPITIGKKLDNYFEISARKSNFKTEIIAGLTTFFAMCYIVLVNPAQIAAGGGNGWLAEIFSGAAGELGAIWNSVYIGGIIAAIIGTVLTAVVGKMPFAQAAGMGLNSFFCTCFVSAAVFANNDGTGAMDAYQGGLIIIFLSGLIFLLLSVTGARKFIAKALPDCLKKAIPAGIGLFIALLGFKAAGIVVYDRWTMVGLLNLKAWGDGAAVWAEVAPALAAFLGVILIAILGKLKVKGNVIIGILGTTVLYYLLTWTVPSFDMGQIGQTFADFGQYGVTAIFKGENWAYAFGTIGILNAICYIITFCLIDMFDTVGTLYGAASAANMLDENGDPINMDGCLTADSIATVAGAMLGTSTVTTYVESAAGVGAGGRTGFASLITAACFVVCLFLSPLASIIPQAATAPALIYVGVLMLRNFGAIDMQDLASAVPAFLTLILMPLTYSIANGIGIGAISYVLIRLFTGKFEKKDIVVAGIAIVFILRFMLTFTGTYPTFAS